MANAVNCETQNQSWMTYRKETKQSSPGPYCTFSLTGNDNGIK